MNQSNNENGKSFLKGFLITVGVLFSILSVCIVLYKTFKKYFRITFECGDCNDLDSIDCSNSEITEDPECCFEDEENKEVEVTDK